MSDSKQFASYPSLAGRVVVISGGATGIGAAMTEAFALQGSRVIILDILAEAAEELTKALAEQGAAHPPIFHRCDVTDIEGGVRAVAARILAAHPRIDAVVNNAANDARQATADLTPEQWDRGLAVNLKHVFFLTQALAAGLEAAGPAASVVNMGSITWNVAGAGMVPYVASKSAIVGLTKRLAHEYGPRGVRVNSIMPGAIATERQKREILTEEYKAQIMDKQALKRFLQPDEIARLALWLVADDSSGITSQSIVVDGGWT